MFMFGTIEVGDVYEKVSLMSEASFDFLESFDFAFREVTGPG